MCHSKILHFLFIASISAFSNSIHATVHDFGNLRTMSDSPSLTNRNFADATYPVLGGVDLAADLHANDYAFRDRVYEGSNYVQDFPNEHNINASGMPLDQSGQNEHFDNAASAAPPAEYASVAAPIPEPETYAMILAGLAMIVFTARRRN
jgi:hypothetical protein